MPQLPSDTPTLFKGRHFDRLLIIQSVRWYITYKLSYRDVCELLAERGVTLVHTTVMRWVQSYVPVFEKQWKKYARPTGSSWRVDETYIKVKGRWTYLYRAVDKQGRTIDFLLSEKRDMAAAKRFFIKAIQNNEAPEKITLDGYEASHTAVSELKAEGVLSAGVEVRTSKYLNNLIEQDHRRVKQRYYPMLGFKNFNNAAVTLSGIELVQKIRKGQFNTSSISHAGAGVPQVWGAVLAT
ncbi:MAG: IS6 family transposase [Pyrinomonadaceae bacterium]|nr:IS6 family transposase [Pyrinomonadaceae bacterium]